MPIDSETLFSDWEKEGLLQPAFAVIERILRAQGLTGKDIAFVFDEVAPIDIALCGSELGREPSPDEFQSYLEGKIANHQDEFVKVCMDIFANRHISVENQLIDLERKVSNDLWIAGIELNDDIDDESIED